MRRTKYAKTWNDVKLTYDTKTNAALRKGGKKGNKTRILREEKMFL
jgi:hypothetical protein